MNTTAKGDSFEQTIADHFEREIDAGRFIARRECCRLYRKKGYYSRDRKKDIIFDLSIEIYRPGASTYGILILIECKNYGHRVPVDDVEEFFAKTQQISGANPKGIIASPNSFQESALNYAASKGIGLLRFLDNNDHHWVLERTTFGSIQYGYSHMKSIEVCAVLYQENPKRSSYGFYCHYVSMFTNSLFEFISELTKETLTDESFRRSIAPISISAESLVEFIPQIDIEKLSANVARSVEYVGGRVDLSSICQKLTHQRGLTVIHRQPSQSELTKQILGRITFEPLRIELIEGPHNDGTRLRFTLAHELGHLFLDHSRYMRSEYCNQGDFDGITKTAAHSDIERMEVQANIFASCILLPRAQFINDLNEIIANLEIRNKGFGTLFVDHQKCNLDTFYHVTDLLRLKYDVSRSVIRLRLQGLGIMTTDDNAPQWMNARPAGVARQKTVGVKTSLPHKR
jgi:Zn-dependent peptidase ImmA (M78 family)